MGAELALLAFDEAPIGIVLTEHRIIKSCNKTFATMFGYQVDELRDQSFRILYASAREFEEIRDIGLAQLKTTSVYLDERIVRRRDGSRFWCRFRAHTLTPNDPLKQTILSFSTISEKAAPLALTARERQVVMHLSSGKTSKEIARQLSLSPRTIDDVRSRLLRKLNVRNTTELLSKIVWAD